MGRHMSSHDPSLLQPGTRLGRRYVIRGHLGGGGMAQVYRGEHETIDRPVAIKVLAEDLARRPSVVVRFLQEAKASSKVRHENVVEVTDFGETDKGLPFMVMEFLEGECLDETLEREGPIPWDRARPMLLQILAALQAAHAHGVIHRDIKPANVFRVTQMGSPDFIKVFDFGIAKVLQPDGSPGNPLTIEGQVMGTPAYMSPEQCLGEKVDARSDLYAVGVIAYEMLTGEPPFVSEDSATLLYNQVYGKVRRMSEVAPDQNIDRGVESIVQRALAKHPKDRPASAQEFAEMLLEGPGKGSSGLMSSLRDLFRRRARP